MLTNAPSRYPNTQVIAPLDGGYVYELGSKYYSVSRDGGSMYYVSGSNWIKCENAADGSISYAAYRVNGVIQQIFKISWTSVTLGQESFVISDVTTDCTSPISLKSVPVWPTFLSTFRLATIKAAVVGNDLHLELQSDAGSKDLLSLYYPNFKTSSAQPFINKVGHGATYDAGSGRNIIIGSSVMGPNNFVYLFQDNTATVTVTNVSVSYVNTLNYANIQSITPVYRFNYPTSFAGNMKEFPTFDAMATMPPNLFFQYYSSGSGVGIDVDFKAMSYSQTVSVGWTGGQSTKYYYKGDVLEVGNTGGTAVKLFLVADAAVGTNPYYTTTKGSGGFGNTVYWNESVLYITNEQSAFNVTGDEFQPQPFEFFRYFQFYGNSISPFCSNITQLTSFSDVFQATMNPVPTFQLSMSGNQVNGMKYTNNANAIIRFNKTSTYIPGVFAFNSTLAGQLSAVAPFAVGNNFRIGIDQWKTANFPYGPVTVLSSSLTISNVCKSQTSVGTVGPANILFPIDQNFFQQFSYSTLISVSASCPDCNDPLVATAPGTGPKSFNDFYLQSQTFSGITFANGNMMYVPMPNPTAATLEDYKTRNFTILITVRATRCGPDSLVTYDISVNNIINNAQKRLEIPVDANSYDIKTTYTLEFDVTSPDGKCTFTSTSTISNAGNNNYQVSSNWITNVNYNSQGNLILNTTDAFRTAISSSSNVISSLSSSVTMQGCPVQIIQPNSFSNGIFTGTIEIPVPPAFNGTKFYIAPTLTGQIGTCIFQTTAVSSPILVPGISYKDNLLSSLVVNSSMVTVSGSALQISLSTTPVVASRLNYYVSNGYTVGLAINGTSFPITESQELFTLDTINFASNVVTLSSNAASYAPCQRSLNIEFQIQSPQCDFMAYRKNVTFGSGTYNLPGSEMFDVGTNNVPNVLYTNGQVIRLPLSTAFKHTFSTSNLQLTANMSANTCGINKLSSQTLNLSGNKTNQTYLDFVLTPQYFDTYALFNLNVSGIADKCKFTVNNYLFNAGQQGSVNTVLSSLNISSSDFQFVPSNGLKIINSAYTSQLGIYSGGYNVVKYVKADTCSTQFFETGLGTNQFSIPDDYYNSTVTFTLQTNVQSGNCQFSTNYTFSGGHTPRIFNAYYNFGNIEILGANLGSITGVCSRTRSITFNYVGGGSKTSSMATSWIDSKIVVQGDVNVISVVVTVGGNSVTALVSQPFFSIDTFLNNEITADGVQQFTIPLNIYGFAVDDLWVIDPSNLLYSSFKAKNGTVMTPMVLNLPKNNLASAVLIYFYIGKYKVPGLISVTIRRTPVISGQNLSPTIQAEGDKYQFAFRIPGNMKYSLVDYTSLTNRYTLLPQHSGLVYDASSILMNPVPGHIITGYDIVAKFVVTSDAVVGQTVLNGFVSGTSTTIGTFSAVNGSEALAFIDQNMTWLYDNQNTKILKVGDFPLTVNLSFIDTKKPVDSVATFAIVASLICPSGYFPNVFGQSSDGKISLCATCPVGATCSATGSASPKGLPGYYEINTNGVFVYAPCLPSDACQGSMLCNSGYGNLQFI